VVIAIGLLIRVIFLAGGTRTRGGLEGTDNLPIVEYSIESLTSFPDLRGRHLHHLFDWRWKYLRQIVV
jgi:hypothetical protein